MKQRKLVDYSKIFIITLLLMNFIYPLSIDMYLPAFEVMSKSLSGRNNNLQVTLSVYILFYAVGQIIIGPISDRYGRKKFFISGILLYSLCTLAISFAYSIQHIIILRMIQGIASAISVGLVNAIIGDYFDSTNRIKMFSIMSAVNVVVPLFAPLLGAKIISLYSWRDIFLFLSLYSIIVFFLAIMFIPETHIENRARSIEIKNVLQTFLHIMSHRLSLCYILMGSFAVSGVFCYLNLSPVFLIEIHHFTPMEFSIIFSINTASLFFGSVINYFLSSFCKALTLIKIGLSIQLIVVAYLFFCITGQLEIYHFFIGFFSFFLSISFILPNAISLLLDENHENKATCTCLFGFCVALFSAVTGFIVPFLQAKNEYVCSLLITICIFLTALLFLYSRKK